MANTVMKEDIRVYSRRYVETLMWVGSLHYVQSADIIYNTSLVISICTLSLLFPVLFQESKSTILTILDNSSYPPFFALLKRFLVSAQALCIVSCLLMDFLHSAI